MTVKTFGAPLTYSKTETITQDMVLVSGQYYIFRKDKENVRCGSRAIVERAIDPVGIKEDFLARMKSEYNESPRVLYVKVSYDTIAEGIYGSFIIVGYAIEMHLQDIGSVTVATIIIAIALAAVLIGGLIVATWTTVRVLDAAEGIGGDLGIWGTGLIILIGFFILAVLFISGGKASVSKKGVKTG